MTNFDPNLAAFQQKGSIIQAQNEDIDTFSVFISNRIIQLILENERVVGILFYEVLARRSATGVLIVGVDANRDVASPFYLSLSAEKVKKIKLERAAAYITNSPLNAYFSKNDILTVLSETGEGLWIEPGKLMMDPDGNLEPFSTFKEEQNERIHETLMITSKKESESALESLSEPIYMMSPIPCPPKCPDSNNNE
ncbi:MAG: hypothetical protein AAF242_20625 [Bacteroidota bacterium]